MEFTLHVIFTFIFCKWLVCCLTGFYQPNRDEFSFCFRVSLKVFEIGRGLAQSAERLIADPEVAGSIPGTGPTLKLLK